MKKILIVIIMLSLLSFSSPQKSYAQYTDIANTTKEYGLDTAAYIAAQIAIKKLTAKTVNWINSGFKGNPGYISDPKQFFLSIGDNVASNFLSQAGLNQLCSPFRAQVRLALVQNYINEDAENYSCSLSILRDNYQAFMGDFSQGGWGAWFELTQRRENNPYGAFELAQNELAVKVGTEQNQFQKELDLSGGFLNFKRCPRGAEAVDPITLIPICTVEEETVTPGTVIAEQLNESLTGPWKSLVAADEFNEIITALMSQLISQVAERAGGLFGASERNPMQPTAPTLTQRINDEQQPFTNYRISATQPSINCTSTGGEGGGGGGVDGGGDGGEGGTANCRSTPGTVSGVPSWPLGSGGGGGGHGACSAYTPNPGIDCTQVSAGAVLSILNNYPASNNGLRAAIGAVQGLYPQAVILDHPIRLDKIDFGNGMVVDVMIGAVGNAGPNGEDSEAEGGWGWLVECACNGNPAGSENPNPSIPLPGTTTYNVSFTITGLGQLTDGTDTCSTIGLGNPSPCVKAYPRNSYQSITATPAIGQTFLGWGGACAPFGLSNTCYGNVTGDGAVVANFSPAP